MTGQTRRCSQGADVACGAVALGRAEMTGEPADGLGAAGRPALVPSLAGGQGRRAAQQRLRTARGHHDAVLRMLEADRYRIDVLHQLSAGEGAIARARRDIVEGHLHGCVADTVHEGRIGDVADEMLAAMSGERPPATRTEHRIVP